MAIPAEAIILAGGLGTRLRAAVPDLPKPLAPIAGRPFLAWLLDHLEWSGIRRAILSVGYRAEAIRAAVGERHGSIAVDYAEEHEPLGTGGALALAMKSVKGAAVFALNGDTLFLTDLQALANTAAQCPSRMAVALHQGDDTGRYGTCAVEQGRIVSFRAAGGTQGGPINGGVYVLPRKLFESFDLPQRFSFERDFLEARTAELGACATISERPFIDIGIPQSFEAAQTLIPAWLSR